MHTELGLCALTSMTKLIKMTSSLSTFEPQNNMGQVIIRPLLHIETRSKSALTGGFFMGDGAVQAMAPTS